MAFRNSIVGGVGSLIRQYIKSPNYVAGTSGWTINKDGSAEFNSGTFRGTVIITAAGTAILVYDGPPALDNLIYALSSSAGVDSFGNHWEAGVTLGAYPAPNNGSITYRIPDVAVGGQVAALQSNIKATVPMKLQFVLKLFTLAGLLPAAHDTTFLLDMSAVNDTGGFQFGTTGQVVKQYYEQVDLDAQVIASAAAATTLANLTQRVLESDYNAGATSFNLATGLWTAPVTGTYLWTFSAEFSTWAGGSRLIQFLTRNGTTTTTAFAMEDNTRSNSGGAVITAMKRLNVTDTVRARIAQVTAANRTIDIAGSPDMCYVSVKLIP